MHFSPLLNVGTSAFRRGAGGEAKDFFHTAITSVLRRRDGDDGQSRIALSGQQLIGAGMQVKHAYP